MRGYKAEKGTLQGYLIGTAGNLLRNRLRQYQRFVDDEPAPVRSELDEALSKQQDLQDLRSAILSLPPSYREVVVLCDLEGMDYSQTAEQLKCPVGTVRCRCGPCRLAALSRESSLV